MRTEELNTIFEELLPDEALQLKVAEAVKNLNDRMDSLVDSTEKQVNKSVNELLLQKNKEINAAFEAIILTYTQEFDSIRKTLDKKIKDLDLSITEAKSFADESNSIVRDELINAKKELIGHSQMLSKRQESMKAELIAATRESLKLIDNKETDIRKSLDAVKAELKKEITTKLTTRFGGGSMPLQVSAGGTVANTRYADINFVGATAVANDTTKKTDITTTGGSISYATGHGAPVSTPTSIGSGYVDLDTNNIYIATGTSSSADWHLIAMLS